MAKDSYTLVVILLTLVDALLIRRRSLCDLP
jgi:hypothetical protein